MKRLLLFALALLAVPSALGQYTRWDGYLTNAQGQAIQGAQVYILVQPATVSAYSPQAPVFSSVTGGALTQPLRTDGFGHVYAYVTETVNAAACSTLGSLCYTIVYISKSTGQVVLPDQVVGGGGGSGPSTGCVPTGGGPYPTADGQGEVVTLTNDGAGCTSSLDLTSSIGEGTDGTLWFHQNWNIQMDSDVDPLGEQTLLQPTFWQMTSSTGNGSPAQVNLQIDDSAGPGGGNPLVIQMAAIKDSPGAGWAGIDLQPSIGGASKATTDLDSILIEGLSAHLGQTFRNYHGIKTTMTGVGGSNEEAAYLVETTNANIGANYCDIITRDPSGTGVRFQLGCGVDHTSTFKGPVEVNSPGTSYIQALEGTPCPTPVAGMDILCSDSVAHAFTISNNGAAYFTPGAGGGGGVSSIDAQTGAFTFAGAGVSHVGNAYTFSGTGSGVSDLNTLTGSVVLAAGANITLTPVGNTITLAATGGGSGAMTLITDTLLGAPAATVTFSSISGSYKTLKLYVQGACSGAVSNDDVLMRANGDTGSNYDRQVTYSTGSGVSGVQTLTSTGTAFAVACSTAPSNESGTYEVTIPNYSSSVFRKMGTVVGAWFIGTGAANIASQSTIWHWRNTAAITDLVLTLSGGSNFITGSRFTLYGIN